MIDYSAIHAQITTVRIESPKTANAFNLQSQAVKSIILGPELNHYMTQIADLNRITT